MDTQDATGTPESAIGTMPYSQYNIQRVSHATRYAIGIQNVRHPRKYHRHNMTQKVCLLIQLFFMTKLCKAKAYKFYSKVYAWEGTHEKVLMGRHMGRYMGRHSWQDILSHGTHIAQHTFTLPNSPCLIVSLPDMLMDTHSCAYSQCMTLMLPCIHPYCLAHTLVVASIHDILPLGNEVERLLLVCSLHLS